MDKATRSKLVEFLGTLDSHSVYGVTELAADFEKAVGIPYPETAPSMSVKDFQRALKSEGRGGYSVYADPKKRVVSGYVLAEFFADEYGRRATDHEAGLMGRGFRYRAAIDRIAEAS